MAYERDYIYGMVYDGDYYGDLINMTDLNSTWNNYSSFDDYCNVDFRSILETMPGYTLCYHILLPIFCSIGIVGSLLTVIVLSRKTMSTSTNSYLISLATADLAFLLIISPKCLETKLEGKAHYQYLAIMTYAHIFLDTFLLVSIWLTVMLAVERYIAICHPLRAMAICTVVRARIIIVSIFAIALIFNTPKFFKFRLEYFQEPCIKQEVPNIQITSLATNETYRSLTVWTSCVLIVFLPFALLLYFNLCLILEIHRSTNYLRYHLASDSNAQTIITGEEMKITLMLISIVVNFFVFESPYIILEVVKLLKKGVVSEHLYLYIAVTILLLAMRSSLNFILYCWFSEKFWNTFKKTFCMPQCILSRAPTWVRSRMWNHSDHGHSNNNRKISYFNTKDTTC